MLQDCISSDLSNVCNSDREWASRVVREWQMSDAEVLKTLNSENRKLIYSVDMNRIYGLRTRMPSRIYTRSPGTGL